MLAETEEAMLAYLRCLRLAKHLRAIEPLPDTDAGTLVQRFAADAPAVYVVYQDFPVDDGAAKVSMAIVCVGRNAAGSNAARQGDGQEIGMYQIVSRVASRLNGPSIGGCSWQVTRISFPDADTLWRNGLECGIVIVASPGRNLDPAIDESDLDEFLQFDSQYDIPPHESKEEHDKWLAEPPDHSTSAPELTDVLILREGESNGQD